MDVTVPDLGDFTDVEVIDILVSEGDVVAAEDSLITLETDKATMDVPSPAAGKVVGIRVEQGSTVSTGDLIVVLEVEEAATEEPADAESDNSSDVTAEPAEPASDAPAEPQLVNVPDLGDFSDVDVIEILVSAGDEVEAEQGLITLETDKATMDVPAPVAGRVLELKVEAGGTVNPGDAVALIQPKAGQQQANKPAGRPPQAARPEVAAPSPAPASASEPSVAHKRALPAVGIVDEAGFSRAHASPSVRKLARELGVDLARVTGSGRKGRISAEDLKAFVKKILKDGVPGAGLPKVPEVDFARFGPVEEQKLSRIQKISGPRLHASWVNLPHVTQHEEADITELEARRQALKADAAARDIKLTPLAFIMRAVVLTLQEFPKFRSSLSGDAKGLVVKNYFHVT